MVPFSPLSFSAPIVYLFFCRNHVIVAVKFGVDIDIYSRLKNSDATEALAALENRGKSPVHRKVGSALNRLKIGCFCGNYPYLLYSITHISTSPPTSTSKFNNPTTTSTIPITNLPRQLTSPNPPPPSPTIPLSHHPSSPHTLNPITSPKNINPHNPIQFQHPSRFLSGNPNPFLSFLTLFPPRKPTIPPFLQQTLTLSNLSIQIQNFFISISNTMFLITSPQLSPRNPLHFYLANHFSQPPLLQFLNYHSTIPPSQLTHHLIPFPPLSRFEPGCQSSYKPNI